jgi:hypothetical protein
MLYLKIAGSVIIMAAALFASSFASAYEKKSVLTLEGFWELINHTKNKIDLSLSDCEDILRSAEREDFGIDLCGVSDFCEAVERNGEYLPRDVKSEIFVFASGFGEARQEEQMKRCERLAAILDKAKTLSRKKLREKIKMERTLILSLALSIILVLW